MAFGKPVACEAFKLGKAALGEIVFVSVFAHALEEAVPEIADVPMSLERGERAPQPVRLVRREACASDGDLHGLLLEQGHAVGLAEYLLELARRILDFLLAVSPPEIGVDHVALDGPRADDGDLDDEIVKVAWLHAWQEAHLGAAFDLEDAKRVCLAEHVVDFRFVGRSLVQRVVDPVMEPEQVERLPDAGEHAKGQDIDLQDPEGVNVILVPADDGPALHGGVLYGDKLVKAAFSDDEAADMLREMAGKALDLGDKLERLRQMAVVGIKADLAEPLLRHAGGVEEAPELGRDRADRICGETHGAAHFADCAFATVMHDRGAEPGTVPPVPVIDMLDHFLAALMLEVDVDVGRLFPGLRNEALEDHGADLRRNRGDAEAVAYH